MRLSPNCCDTGFTLVELIIAALIAGVVAAISLPLYTRYVDRAKNAQAVADLLIIEMAIQRFHTETFELPDTLDDLETAGMLDPWDNPYRYLNMSLAENVGELRKDRNQVPLNSDYDLYSMGKDGLTNPSLRPDASHDDIIRARNGGYIGLAAEY